MRAHYTTLTGGTSSQHYSASFAIAVKMLYTWVELFSYIFTWVELIRMLRLLGAVSLSSSLSPQGSVILAPTTYYGKF